jgi:hypothetical protein
MMMTDYYNALDRSYGRIEPNDISSSPGVAVDTISLGPQEIGTSTHPMQHQVQSFAAKIREGASKIELSFMGAGKSNAQQPSPEAFGAKDRRDIREMAEMNNIKTSVHAPLHGESLAGLGKEGFSGEARQHVLEEIERAIQFSSEATKGGAIVFHTGEWQRPMSEIKDKTGAQFLGFKEEKEKAPVMVVDERTGNIQAVRKDYYVYEPKFHTAESYEKVLGKKLVGTVDDKTGLKIEADDWIDMDGHPIKRAWLLDEKKAELLFNRVPVWNKDKTNFEIERVDFATFEKQADKLSKELGKDVAPEVLFWRTQLSNKVLQAKGHSLFYARHYEETRETRDKIKEALDFYSKIDENMPENEKWKLTQQKHFGRGELSHLIPPENMSTVEYLKEKLESHNNDLRHVHESSAASDAQAKEALDQMNRMKTVEEYGLDKSAWTIAQAGIKAMQYSKSHEKELNEKIFVAPENWRPEQYGSHPDEIRSLVTTSRKKMAEQLKKEGHSEEEAKKLAKDHIKATVDIGHFNMWRQHFQAKEGESPEKRNQRFDKWMLDETEKLAKEGIIGHVHLTDNFGYDDEHLTPGQGNVPMKEFIKRMEKAGMKDMIAEAGSFNGLTVMHDTWALMGSPVYSTGRVPSFRSVHDQQMGYHSPAMYIVGAYSPSNEWHLWSEVPLE